MTFVERAINFDCGDDVLVGVVAMPERPRHTGVLIIVGGPQYRVGSHRQFVLLARRIARQGSPAMRFDYRGMGDSTGDKRSFEDVADDISAAIAAFRRMCPVIDKVILWGLCDAASAALLYVQVDRPAVAGLVLANPWLRSKDTSSRTLVKHYYAVRLFERQFWSRLLRGDIHLAGAVHGLFEAARAARGRPAPATGESSTFRERMRLGMAAFRGPVLLLMSGRDLTAREFEDTTKSDRTWRRLLIEKPVERCDIGEADHTFSTIDARERMETATCHWIERRFASS
jgi:exosortase A-associated hydrolase 1